ncbi:MAG TPA: DUF6807 family protein, partial [Prolixibacteraceae bacterium]|nr:DUF6807 family protein [Prolixibacteraceae bacterium]
DIEFRLTEKNNGELKYNAYWYTSDNTGDPFMQIKTKVTVHSQKIRYRRVDFRMVLQPLEYNLSIGGSDNVKGYGGFSFRMATNKHTKFYNDAGDSIIPQNTAMDAGAFVNIINPDHQNGVVIFNNPRNPEISGWILRQDDSAQNCAWPGRVPVKLNVEQPVTLQYSILIHNGKLKNRAIQRILSN